MHNPASAVEASYVCTNTRSMYFLRSISAEIFTENEQSDDSIDNFLADTKCFTDN